MHIKNVEITGFKSYGSRKLVELDPGINVIIGENGKGKSNVYDGERCAPALRAWGSSNALLAGALRTAARFICAACAACAALVRGNSGTGQGGFGAAVLGTHASFSVLLSRRQRSAPWLWLSPRHPQQL
jgi:hypothetical protein